MRTLELVNVKDNGNTDKNEKGVDGPAKINKNQIRVKLVMNMLMEMMKIKLVGTIKRRSTTITMKIWKRKMIVVEVTLY